MTPPTIILRRKKIIIRDSRGRPTRWIGYECDNGVTYKSRESLAKAVGLTGHTISYRENIYGLNNPAVLYPGNLSKKVLEEIEKRPPEPKIPEVPSRSIQCTREGNRCDDYGDYLSIVCELDCYCGNCNPEDTSECYNFKEIPTKRPSIHGSFVVGGWYG
jgi:hypothetical protein